MSTRKIRLLTWFFVSVAFIFFIVFIKLKLHTLSFDQVDYPFYLQFSSKLFDPSLSARYSLNPEGGNWLGYTGVEGKDNFHQSLHLELVKYAFAVIYRLSGTPAAIFVFIAAIYLMPVFYLFFIHPGGKAIEAYFVLLFAVLYLGYPAAIHTITFDLRPRVLLVPFLCLAILAAHYRRPVWERVMFFCLLCLTREEVLLLGALIIVYNLLRSKNPSNRLRSTSILATVWFISLSLIYAYLHWTKYQIDPNTSPFAPIASNPALFFSCGLLFVILIVSASRFWNKIEQRITHPGRIQILSYSLIFIFLSWPLFEPLSRPGSTTIQKLAWVYMNISMQSLYFSALLLLLVLAYTYIHKPAQRRNYLLALTALAIFSIAFSLKTLPGFIQAYRQEAESARLVFNFRDSLDRHTAYVLCDYATYQAFYDFERVAAFNRLPWYLVKGNTRYYPKNIPALTRLLEDKVQYVVISKQSLADIQELLAQSAEKPINVSENEQYLIMQLR
jgi:hypothetical protein